MRQALAADAGVVGRARAGGIGAMSALPGAVSMEVGRPVPTAPPGSDGLNAERILAWNDAPEARRAVSAALPFRRRAKHASVVSARENARSEGADRVAECLTRHGAEVGPHPPDATAGATARNAADGILRLADTADADLAVLGGYGRSRVRECSFGGVTRDVLNRSPVRCPMSQR